MSGTHEASPLPLQDRTGAAVRDLESRSLCNISGDLAQLVYLASARDYNSGEYHHAGLAYRHGPDAAADALAQCHQRAFRGFLLLPLEDVCAEVATYVKSTSDPAKTMEAWRALKAYRLLIPAPCDPVSASLFSSNIQVALGALVLEQCQSPPGDEPGG